ncbi:MAG: cupin domain-containing protein [Candidatus Acetothermia bacterium]
MILRGRDNVESTVVENIHGGSGKCEVRQLLGYEPRLDVPGFPDDFDSSIEFMHETTLRPGTKVGLHPQEGNEEIYYVIKGKGKMRIDDEVEEMTAGDVSLTKSGSKHSLENIGDDDLVLIVIEASV